MSLGNMRPLCLFVDNSGSRFTQQWQVSKIDKAIWRSPLCRPKGVANVTEGTLCVIVREVRSVHGCILTFFCLHGPTEGETCVGLYRLLTGLGRMVRGLWGVRRWPKSAKPIEAAIALMWGKGWASLSLWWCSSSPITCTCQSACILACLIQHQLGMGCEFLSEGRT